MDDFDSELDEDANPVIDQLNDVWDENVAVDSDKERVLTFLQEHDDRPHQVTHIMSDALGMDVITQADMADMPDEFPNVPGDAFESAEEGRREKFMITQLAQYQANLARIKNLLEDLVYEGEIERRELPFVDVYGRSIDYEGLSEERVEELRESGDTETFYRFVGDAEE